jgi:voltage-gated sodium channel
MSIKKQIHNDDLILSLILINVGVLYLHTFDELIPYYFLFEIIDIVFTLIFAVEIGIKIYEIDGNRKLKKYLKSNWNKIDFYSVLFSLPSIFLFFFDQLEVFTLFIILRSLRVFKFLRIIEYIPDGKVITSKMFKAFRSIIFIIFAFTIYSVIISLISVSLFKHYSPNYFHNAFDAFFTIFKVFSGDGFSDVVADIEINSGKGEAFMYFTKFYFVFIVFTGSILGLSLIHSIFIDQMSRFDKKSVKETDELGKKIDLLLKKQDELITEINELKQKSNDINRENQQVNILK